MAREDLSQILNGFGKAVDQIMEFTENLDAIGVGLPGMSTRTTCALELLRFLLYIADGCSVINETQATLLNSVVKHLGERLNPQAFKPLLRGMGIGGVSDVIPNATMKVFLKGDLAVARQNGGKSSGSMSLLVNVFQLLGKSMASVSNNPISEDRYRTAMNQIIKSATRLILSIWTARISNRETAKVLTGAHSTGIR